MKKLLITGFSGFVARHMLEYLKRENISTEILGIDIACPVYNYGLYGDFGCLKVRFECVDMLDAERVSRVIASFMPDYILHLASFSSVAYSWENPEESFLNNTNIFLNLIDAVKNTGCKCRILSVGSSEQYGNVDPDMIPVTEEAPLSPVSPYAVARVSQEMLSKLYSNSLGMDIVLTRSFNHIGRWQNTRFVVPGIIDKIGRIRDSGAAEGTVMMGDTSIVRDFIAVDDVVRAYWALLNKGKCGEVYNVCRGEGVSIKDIVMMVSDMMEVKVDIRTDPKLVRPADNRVIIGSHDKLTKDTGWNPEVSIKDCLRDMIITRNER